MESPAGSHSTGTTSPTQTPELSQNPKALVPYQHRALSALKTCCSNLGLWVKKLRLECWCLPTAHEQNKVAERSTFHLPWWRHEAIVVRPLFPRLLCQSSGHSAPCAGECPLQSLASNCSSPLDPHYSWPCSHLKVVTGDRPCFDRASAPCSWEWNPMPTLNPPNHRNVGKYTDEMVLLYTNTTDQKKTRLL